jgi:hypothetical protein
MGIANVIQTATSATHHHHHTELPKNSSKTELLIGIMKSQREKQKHQLCWYLQEFCGSARIPTIVTLGGIVVASFASCSSLYLMCMLYPTTTTTTTNTNFFNIIKLE